MILFKNDELERKMRWAEEDYQSEIIFFFFLVCVESDGEPKIQGIKRCVAYYKHTSSCCWKKRERRSAANEWRMENVFIIVSYYTPGRLTVSYMQKYDELFSECGWFLDSWRSIGLEGVDYWLRIATGGMKHLRKLPPLVRCPSQKHRRNDEFIQIAHT